MSASTANPQPSPTSQRVHALPWPTVELLTASLRKLSHDVTNSLVAAVSMVDLALLKSPDPSVADSLQRLRGQILRPRTTLQTALGPMPLQHGDRPRTLVALERYLSDLGREHAVELQLQLQPHDLPPVLSETEWVHVLANLGHNALDAHADDVLQDEGPGEPRFVTITATRHGSLFELAVQDNGPGCTDLVAAASGKLRRAGGGHLGFGLAVAAAMVERAGGHLLLQPRQPRGLSAIARLTKP